MNTFAVIDPQAPGGYKSMDLPKDFKEWIECKATEPLEPFLDRYSPLTAHSCWVSVRSPTNNDGNEKDGECTLQQAVARIKARGPNVTVTEVDVQALHSRCLSGKWKIKVDASQVDYTWRRIASGVHSGELSSVCISAKVSTAITQAVRSRGNVHTIYIYVDNYLNEESIRQLRQDLLQLLDGDSTGLSDTAKIGHFKPDIYTFLGWGDGRMPPSIPVDRIAWVEPVCSACGTTASTLKKCTACKSAQYCNKACQRAHWKEHTKLCKLLKIN